MYMELLRVESRERNTDKCPTSLCLAMTMKIKIPYSNIVAFEFMRRE